MAPNLSALKRFQGGWYVLLPLAGACIPVLLIAAMVARYGVNVPFWDQWELVRLLDKAATGQLTFRDFWEQHNEHRIVFPRVVMLALASVTRWDIRYELAANIVVALGVLGMLALLIERTVRPVAPGLTSWLILAASLSTFSLTQWENWLWGWQLQIFMNALAAVVSVWALARWGPRWPGLALAIFAATAGTLSFATGLILLALVPLGLIIAPQFDQGTGRLKRLAFAGAGVVGVVTLYLNGFHLNPVHPTPLFLFSHPLSYAHYILIYLGSGLGAWSKTVSASWGAMGIVTFVWCGAWLWTRSRAYRHILLPWILLGLYGILSGFMTGIGRAGFGEGQGMASRYITISSLFWVSLIVIVVLAITHLLEDGIVSRTRSLAVVAVAASLITLAGVSYGASWIHAKAALESRSGALLRSGECLLYYDMAPDECLGVLFPDVVRLRKAAQRLETLSFGPFAQSRLEQLLSWYTVVSGPEPAGWIDEVAVHEGQVNQTRRSGDVVVSGWAMDPFSRSPAASVLVVVGDQVMGRAATGQQRADVAKALDQNGLLHSGWTFHLGLSRLVPGPHLVEAYALLNDERRIVKLVGSRVIEVRE